MIYKQKSPYLTNIDKIDYNKYLSNAKKFSKNNENKSDEKSDTQTFWNDFFQIFGVNREGKLKYEYRIRDKISKNYIYIDGLWEGKLLIEQKSKNGNLVKAMKQAEKYIYNLPMEYIPQYIIISDFQKFVLKNLNNQSEIEFELKDLSKYIHLFLFIKNKELKVDSFPVSKKAAIEIGKVCNELEKSGYNKSQLTKYLSRIVYCLFADDTGIFNPSNLFLEYIKSSKIDGSDLGNKLFQLFSVLGSKDGEYIRTSDPELDKFPYINGGLFKEKLIIPKFNKKSRQVLIDVSKENWSKVSPSIFGNLFQSIMNEKERHDIGAHYTTEENILKVINPLFMDELKHEFFEILKIKNNIKTKKLHEFQIKLSMLKFFDPACGAGNFLIITYREIRRLEHDVIFELTKNKLFKSNVKVSVNQFYGIDINEFSVNIAYTAMWLMDHLLNIEFNDKCNATLSRIPIKSNNTIIHGDAMDVNWNDVLPANKCSYIFGNPPYIGSKIINTKQRKQIIKLVNSDIGKRMDYVCGWFLKAGEYINKNTKFAFVSTNAITHGLQVGLLWPILFNKYNLEIIFAYNEFKWNSDAKNKSEVTVVIIGIGNKSQKFHKLLYGKEIKYIKNSISPYLHETNDPNLIVKNEKNPINKLPKIKMGSMILDDGNYIFTENEKNEFLKIEPNAVKYLKQFMSSKDFIQNTTRYILNLHNITGTELSKLPHIKKRMHKVVEFRKKRNRQSNITNSPTLWEITTIPVNNYLLIPRVTTNKRKIIPIGYLDNSIIPSDSTMISENVNVELFGLLISNMHMIWLDKIGGKLGTGYRYSAGIVYNTFPVPKSYKSLKEISEKIIEIRINSNLSFYDLYDPNTMPVKLKQSHEILNNQVDKLYRPEKFENDNDRLMFLMNEYKKLVN